NLARLRSGIVLAISPPGALSRSVRRRVVHQGLAQAQNRPPRTVEVRRHLFAAPRRRIPAERFQLRSKPLTDVRQRSRLLIDGWSGEAAQGQDGASHRPPPRRLRRDFTGRRPRHATWRQDVPLRALLIVAGSTPSLSAHVRVGRLLARIWHTRSSVRRALLRASPTGASPISKARRAFSCRVTRSRLTIRLSALRPLR